MLHRVHFAILSFVFLCIGATPGCTYLMWDRVRHSAPELVCVKVNDHTLEYYDVLYEGQVYRHEVTGEKQTVSENGDSRTIQWKTALTTVVPAGNLQLTCTSTSDWPLRSSKIPIPEWDGEATLHDTADNGSNNTGDLHIRGTPPGEFGEFEGNARGRVPVQSAPTGKVVLAAFATPITVAIDVVVVPVGAVVGIIVLVFTGGHH